MCTITYSVREIAMAYGLKPTRSITSATWNDANNRYYIASGYNAPLFKGDPVLVNANGTITIAAAGASSPISGIFNGVKYTGTFQGINGNQVFSPYWVAGTVTQGTANAIASVCDDPDTIFSVLTNGAIAATDLYANANLVAGAGSPLSGQSGWMLDVASIGGGAGSELKQVKILDLVPMPGNNFGVAAGSYVWVKLNAGSYLGSTVANAYTGTPGV